MAEFWETNFKEKQEMWGSEPADATFQALELLEKAGLRKILIPGFGYGRNARPFIEKGFEVTGIEISETAIELARKHFGESLRIHHGSVSDMPFDHEMYEGVYCYALLHLLNKEDRQKLISGCYKQLKPGGQMIFVSLSKDDFRYGKGEDLGGDTFRTKHGIDLFFYDAHTIAREFGLHEAIAIQEPREARNDRPSEKFWFVVCKK